MTDCDSQAVGFSKSCKVFFHISVTHIFVCSLSLGYILIENKSHMFNFCYSPQCLFWCFIHKKTHNQCSSTTSLEKKLEFFRWKRWRRYFNEIVKDRKEEDQLLAITIEVKITHPQDIPKITLDPKPTQLWKTGITHNPWSRSFWRITSQYPWNAKKQAPKTSSKKLAEKYY